MKPVLQLALDFLDISRAVRCAREAARGGVAWIEAGTPLIKSEGLNAVRALRAEFPDHYLVADLKTLDAGRTEFEAAAKAGANCATVCVTGSDATIVECIEAGRNYGIDVAVDLLGLDPDAAVAMAKKCAGWGAHHVGLHVPIDAQMQGEFTLETLQKLRPEIDIPIALAGGINSENAASVVEAGGDILIVGGAITKAPKPEEAAAELQRAIRDRVSIKTELYRRARSDEEIREVLERVSTCNVSDALHRSGDLPGLMAVTPGKKYCGKAVTVRTYPGDWAKPVEAIDVAGKGDVIMVDAGGAPPAVWGELASESCLQQGISGIVIDGAIRDVDSIRSIGFSAHARIVTPTAGEPKGFGEIGAPVKMGGVLVEPGDWILADDSGVVRIPKARAAEMANRAQDVLEHENRIREEIRQASTLSKVAELSKWEKQVIKKVNASMPSEPSS